MRAVLTSSCAGLLHSQGFLGKAAILLGSQPSPLLGKGESTDLIPVGIRDGYLFEEKAACSCNQRSGSQAELGILGQEPQQC